MRAMSYKMNVTLIKEKIFAKSKYKEKERHIFYIWECMSYEKESHICSSISTFERQTAVFCKVNNL